MLIVTNYNTLNFQSINPNIQKIKNTSIIRFGPFKETSARNFKLTRSPFVIQRSKQSKILPILQANKIFLPTRICLTCL